MSIDRTDVEDEGGGKSERYKCSSKLSSSSSEAAAKKFIARSGVYPIYHAVLRSEDI